MKIGGRTGLNLTTVDLTWPRPLLLTDAEPPLTRCFAGPPKSVAADNQELPTYGCQSEELAAAG